MILSTRFDQAFLYAAILHAGQVRKATDIPYLSHLLAVTALVLENGGSEDEAIAALLHDAVEDAGGPPRLADIRLRFGSFVAEIVAGCTDTDQTPKPPWRQRKETYLAHLRQAGPAVQLVSLADKVHNARSLLADHQRLGRELWLRFSGGKAGTLWYYGALLDCYDHNQPRLRVLWEELVRVVRELEKLAAADGYSDG
jgi:GTP pyrophosphokinase